MIPGSGTIPRECVLPARSYLDPRTQYLFTATDCEMYGHRTQSIERVIYSESKFATKKLSDPRKNIVRVDMKQMSAEHREIGGGGSSELQISFCWPVCSSRVLIASTYISFHQDSLHPFNP